MASIHNFRPSGMSGPSGIAGPIGLSGNMGLLSPDGPKYPVSIHHPSRSYSTINYTEEELLDDYLSIPVSKLKEIINLEKSNDELDIEYQKIYKRFSIIDQDEKEICTNNIVSLRKKIIRFTEREELKNIEFCKEKIKTNTLTLNDLYPKVKINSNDYESYDVYLIRREQTEEEIKYFNKDKIAKEKRELEQKILDLEKELQDVLPIKEIVLSKKDLTNNDIEFIKLANNLIIDEWERDTHNLIKKIDKTILITRIITPILSALSVGIVAYLAPINSVLLLTFNIIIFVSLITFLVYVNIFKDNVFRFIYRKKRLIMREFIKIDGINIPNTQLMKFDSEQL